MVGVHLNANVLTIAGSAKGNYIQECGMDFNDSSSAAPVWYMWANFHDSDPSSGVAAVLSDSGKLRRTEKG